MTLNPHTALGCDRVRNHEPHISEYVLTYEIERQMLANGLSLLGRGGFADTACQQSHAPRTWTAKSAGPGGGPPHRRTTRMCGYPTSGRDLVSLGGASPAVYFCPLTCANEDLRKRAKAQSKSDQHNGTKSTTDGKTRE